MAKALGVPFYTAVPTQTRTKLCFPATATATATAKGNQELLRIRNYSTPPPPPPPTGRGGRRKGRGGGGGGGGGESVCPVPLDQQPIIEYQNLCSSFPFSWASGDVVEYFSRLVATGLCFGLLVGLPVSSFGSHSPFHLVLGSLSASLFVVTMTVLRMYLGWAYVGNRLLSATVEYEETGWYDGQIWVKTAEVLARDRLLGSFQVKPVLSRLKNSLVALAISLFICVALLLNYEGSQKENWYLSNEAGDQVVAGVYNDDSARLFEPDAFYNEPGLVPE